MSVQTKIDKEGIYFITFTCYRWLPLIELSLFEVKDYRDFVKWEEIYE